MYVSTLHDFVKALGGELKITAKFPEGTVEITQFEKWALSLADLTSLQAIPRDAIGRTP
jgi:hypothetical protein